VRPVSFLSTWLLCCASAICCYCRHFTSAVACLSCVCGFQHVYHLLMPVTLCRHMAASMQDASRTPCPYYAKLDELYDGMVNKATGEHVVHLDNQPKKKRNPRRLPPILPPPQPRPQLRWHPIAPPQRLGQLSLLETMTPTRRMRLWR
jgi:hypothetical protein